MFACLYKQVVSSFFSPSITFLKDLYLVTLKEDQSILEKPFFSEIAYLTGQLAKW